MVTVPARETPVLVDIVMTALPELVVAVIQAALLVADQVQPEVAETETV